MIACISTWEVDMQPETGMTGSAVPSGADKAPTALPSGFAAVAFTG